MIVPREHGAWGLLLVPLFTGAAVGMAANHRILPVFLLTVAALALFWLRTPLESLLGTTPLKAQTSAERRPVSLVILALTAISAACLATLFWNHHNRGLLLLGGAAAAAFALQAVLKKLSRNARPASQLIGAFGLTCTAPAAYYAAGGGLDARAFALWAANWIFAGDQIHFVQLRIHSARAATFREKMARGMDILCDSDPATSHARGRLALALDSCPGDRRFHSSAWARHFLVLSRTGSIADSQSGLVGDATRNSIRPVARGRFYSFLS